MLMRNKVLLLGLALLFAGISVKAQRSIRIGYIDMDYILENVPEYKEAQGQLDNRVNEWKNEIDSKLAEVEQMQKTLDNERVLLTQELIEEREDEISFLKNEIQDYQQKRFGPQGDLMIQRSNLVKPVQDQVFNAVQEISKNRQYDFVFDKSADLVMLYASERHDISDQVLLSINRASKRKQVNSKKDKNELEKSEALTVEQQQEITEREKEANAKREEREKLIEDRQTQREEERAAKEKAFKERRERLLEERQNRKDSIAAARNNKGNEATPVKTEEGKPEMSAEERKQQILKERQARKDSILEIRQKKRDSIIQARERKKDSVSNSKNNIP